MYYSTFTLAFNLTLRECAIGIVKHLIECFDSLKIINSGLGKIVQAFISSSSLDPLEA